MGRTFFKRVRTPNAYSNSSDDLDFFTGHLAKIGLKGFLPKAVLSKLQSGQGTWTLFDCAVLKLTGKLSSLAWIVFARRFSCLSSLGSVRQELKRLLPNIVSIWIGGQKEEVDEVGNEEEELNHQEINYELEEGATEEERLEAQAADLPPPDQPTCVVGGETDPLLQAFKHLSILQRPDVRKRKEELGESDRPQMCSKCGEPRRGHVCGAVGSTSQKRIEEGREVRRQMARDMLLATPVEVLTRIDLEVQASTSRITAAAAEADGADPLIDVAPPHAPLPPQPRGPSALQVRLSESEETNRKQALEMKEIKRELASLKSLSVGQQLGARRNRPLPSEHVAVPVPWVHSGPSTSAATGRPPAPPPAAVKKIIDPLAKFKKK